MTDLEFLSLAPVRMQDAANAMSERERDELARALSSLAAAAAFASAYLSSRAGGGCGDQGHREAAGAANRARKATRKALGYHITPSIDI